MNKIKVLDHGYIGLFEHMGSDLSIVRNARVSYDAEWRTGEDEGKDSKLLKYLLANKHTSPFEAVTFTFDIKCPIFVARQWHRHRTFSFNEISARYAQLPAEYYVPDAAQITTQSKSSKQARTTEQHHAADAWRTSFDEHCRLAFEVYEAALRDGVPRELARSVLPMATYTHFFGTVNLLNLIKFLRLRLHPHAQWEIRQYAYAILELITPVVPVTMGHLQASLQEISKGGL